MKKASSNVFHVCNKRKGLSNDDVGAARDKIISGGDTAGSWFRNRRFRSREVEGATPQNDFKEAYLFIVRKSQATRVDTRARGLHPGQLQKGGPIT